MQILHSQPAGIAIWISKIANGASQLAFQHHLGRINLGFDPCGIGGAFFRFARRGGKTGVSLRMGLDVDHAARAHFVYRCPSERSAAADEIRIDEEGSAKTVAL